MCSNNPSGMMPYGLKIPTPTQYVPYPSGMTQMAMDLHRAQLYDYSARLQYTLRGYPAPIGLSPYQSHPADPFGHAYLYKHDPRARFVTEEPKPSQSYIGLISMAILSHPEKKMVLSDIYQYILDNYAYFRSRGPGWRNSIRHNLSLNDCFIKSGRSANGKGHYWAIHPANLEDFKKGDFRRRRAQRRVRRHMGLSIGDDEDSLSPSPSNSVPVHWEDKLLSDDENSPRESDKSSDLSSTTLGSSVIPATTGNASTSRKRLFDMESLLAPESRPKEQRKVCDISYRVQTVASPVEQRVITTTDASTIKTESEVNDKEPVPDSTQDSSHSEPTTPSPVGNSESRLISPDEHRGLWKSPNLLPGGMSAFPNTSSCTWSNISPFAYPLMSAPYPLAVPTAALSLENVQRWRESFCRISERPMEKTFKLDEQ